MSRQNEQPDNPVYFFAMIGLLTTVTFLGFGLFSFFDLAISFVLANAQAIASVVGSGLILLVGGLVVYHLYNVIQIKLKMRRALDELDDFELRKEAYREYLKEEGERAEEEFEREVSKNR